MAKKIITAEEAEALGLTSKATTTSPKRISAEQAHALGLPVFTPPTQPQPKANLPVGQMFGSTFIPSREQAKDFAGDVRETGSSIMNTIRRTGGKLKDTITAGAEGKQGVLETGLQTAGFLTGGAFGLATDVGVGLGKLALPQGAEDYIGQKFQKGAEKVISSSPVQAGIEAYQGASPRTQRNVEAGFEVASALPLPPLYRAGKLFVPKAADAVVDTTKKIVSPVYEATEKIVKSTIKPKSLDNDVVKIVGEISQINNLNKLNDAKKALSTIDVSDVKTYNDLANKTNKKISTLSTVLDDALDTKKDLYTIDKLAITKDINGQSVQANFVESALNQLENLYKNIEDPFSATRINQLKQKALSEGLTVKDINNIAKEYGTEFKAKAFSKSGEPLTSVTAQGFENVRTGVKDTARDLFDDPIYKATDEELSKLYTLKQSSEEVAKKVQTLKNRIKERKLGEKIGRLIFQVVDTVSLGTVGGFTRAILPRGQGFKVLNALDLEKQLKNNLNQLDNLLNISDKNQLENELRKIINQSQALPANQLNTKSAANTAKNVDIPTQSTTLPPKSTGLINKIKNTPNKQGGFIKLPQGKGEQSVSQAKSSLPKNTTETFIGEVTPAYKPAPLTTKLLKKLEGKTTVSKQFISDLTNSPDLKQVEKDLIRAKLEGKGNTINVADFGKEVEAELLPLKVNKARDMYRTSRGSTGGRYENITLSDDLRGNVKNYEERIYESPIKTSAGEVHFGQPKDKVEGYFGHTRIEDMADNSTRRVIEVQSDLFQKGNLEREIEVESVYDNIKRLENNIENIRIGKVFPTTGKQERNKIIASERDKVDNLREMILRRDAKKKLSQYNNPTAHFRMIREEIQKASKDGKSKLQFPTGETAMKIEGLGGQETRWFDNLADDLHTLKQDDLIVGKEVRDGTSDWIITDVLGDGKFKAVPKELSIDELKTGNITDEQMMMLEPLKETFDISGKVDTNNPIYKFYDKEVQKYLKNNYDAKLVTDEQGVTWFEVPVKKEYKNMPIEAFGLVGALGGASLMSNE